MRDRNSDDLTTWEQAFVKLNDKLGNEVWGIREEGNGSGKSRLRIFINHESWEKKVLTETNGVLDGHPLVFTVYNQNDYARAESRRHLDEDLKKRIKDHAENEATTRDTDGDVQGNSR